MSKLLHPKHQGAEWTTYDTTITSTAKQKYSFPKSDRFRAQTRLLLNDRVCYDLPSTLKGRATSFGFGNRSGGKEEGSRRSKLLCYPLLISFQIPLPRIRTSSKQASTMWTDIIGTSKSPSVLLQVEMLMTKCSCQANLMWLILWFRDQEHTTIRRILAMIEESSH